MNHQTKMNFKNQNLVVDWISFKFQNFDPSTRTKIENHILNFGFDCFEIYGKQANPQKRLLRHNQISTKLFL